ncbi:MAG: OmpA family protein [Prevotella sp.]|jgi:outer membrane protein OmpA-like peptidoglycan-associated protein|nr:OmpA family protein [Prevotella sp.]
MKKVSLLLVLVFAAMTTFAQTSGYSTREGRNTTFVRNGFWDNWFIGVGAGANVYFGDHDKDAKFLSRPTVAPQFQIGKWYNPYFGGRAKVTGGSLHNFGPNAQQMMHNKYLGFEFDLLWNVSDYLLKYNSKRVYSFIPYIGLGGMWGWDYKNAAGIMYPTNYLEKHPGASQQTMTLNAGIINNFRLSERVSFAVEVSGAMVKEDFDKQMGGDWSYDILANASASLIFKIGKKTDFSEAVLLDQGLIDDLNSQINKLRQENETLRNRTCPPAETKVVEKIVEKQVAAAAPFVSNVVFFRIGSAVIDKNQEVSIYNTAKYLQDNPNKNVKIVGYADKKTGSASVNQKISEKRAKNVADVLIKKYNINSNRVKVEWKGDTEQPYAENAWNRVAIFFAE